MKLRIDNREHKLIELTNDNSLNFIEISTLDIGDIHICDNSNNILIIFERKTIPDLLSSIKDGRYEWHQDIGPDLGSIRKISITVQLSEPDDYEGGDLELWLGGNYEECKKEGFIKSPRKAGCVFLFPSYMMHRVAPLTKGTRKSFVLWLGGAHYR